MENPTPHMATQTPVYLDECGVSVVSGVDMSSSSKAKQRCPWTQLTIADASRLPYSDDSFDLVLACEALEHVMAPGEVLREAARVSKGHCVFSVPFEPLWRTLNMLRGAYVKNLGNTPGHVQHWTAGSFIRLLQDHFRVVDVRRPLPWTMALCEVATR